MTNFNQKFTRWYYHKGYRMEWEPCDYGDGIGRIIFHCPWWVRPMTVWFFSPCTYYHMAGYSGMGEE